MNQCDYDHETNEETRLLPLGGGGNIIICKRHYEKEIAERVQDAKEQGRDITGDYSYLPRWETLKIYNGQ